jgi:hypothetical protein
LVLILSRVIPSPLSSPLLEERGFCLAKLTKVENQHTVLPFSFRRRDLRDEVRK